jgi:heme-degrading monooxygenase HmoA
MAGTTFRVLLRMVAHPGHERDFERAWSQGSPVITGQPANLSQSLARCAEEPGVYWIVSDWVDEPSFRAYEQSAEHLAHRARLHPYRASGSMTTMDVLAELPGAARTATPAGVA